jgi:hypothetical protein
MGMIKQLLLAFAACAAMTAASAQPGPGGWRERDRNLDPEIREAVRDYCRIMNRRSDRNRDVRLPRVCYRLFPGVYQPAFPPRRPQ